MRLPPYDTLKLNYPTGADGELIKRQIGGEVTEGWLGPNTCVIRMSKAFNYAGRRYEIPAHHHGLKTVRGADGKRYAYRVAEFIQYLRFKYGAPAVTRTGDAISVDPFLNQKGVIAWNISGWNDATGHFTLWDGSTGLYEGSHNYFADFPTSKPEGALAPWLTRVELWVCP